MRVGRVKTRHLTPRLVESIDRWCSNKRISLLYFLAAIDDDQTVELAEKNHYHLVDIRVTVVQSVEAAQDFEQPPMPGLVIRDCRDDDVPVLMRIAAESHRHSRFYYDRRLPNHLCDRFYETWIRESCGEYADRVFVAEKDGVPVGYNTCHLDSDSSGRIGLLGVDKSSRGQGVGKHLAIAALRWFQSLGVHNVVAVTQGRNLDAISFYQHQNFVMKEARLSYHKWY